MATSNRIKYLTSLVGEAFSLPDYEASEPFSNAKFKGTFEAWMKGTGPAHMFVYYQKPYKMTDQGEPEEIRGSREEFFVTDGEKEKLYGKGIYFLRCNAPGKAINPSGQNDAEVLFGEISEHTVSTLNTIINNVYKPLTDKMEPADWGKCEDEQKKEFLATFDKFAKDLQEALKSLNSNIVLQPYPEKYRGDAKNINNSRNINVEMITAFEEIFNQWSEKIEATLEEAETSKVDKDAGPMMELEYWKQRMRKLTCVSEQLRSKNCRTVYDVLALAASSNSGETVTRPKDKIYLATSKWRGIELKVTEALSEAKDNVKYLQTLEKFIEPLYNGNPESIKETLPALMNSIKMIHTIARYYNTNERMTGLFQKITNQMILNCKFNIINFRRIKLGQSPQGTMNPGPGRKVVLDDSHLWEDSEYPPDELIAMFRQCQDLKDAYIAQYRFTKERLETMPKAKQFDFSPNQIFSKFELFSRRVGKLVELFGTIRQFNTLQQHNLEDIEGIVKDFDQCVLKLRKKNHKLLDYSNDTLDRDFVEFNVEVSHVENSLTAYIDKNFDVIVNIEDSLKLLRKFRSILHRDNLQAGLNNKYSILFAKYSSLILKIEEQYQKHRNQPPIVRNLPTVSGSITWSRHLFHRASVPMEHFPKELLRTRETKKPVKQVASHNRITYTLFYFEYEWRQRWIVEVEKAKAGLLATLIIRHPNNNKLYVNFDAEILTLIREAKCLSRIGIEIPESAKIVLLQEEKFKAYNNELQFVLGEYDRIVNKIRPNTKSLLVPHLEDLEYKLRPGMVTLTWTSMNIDGYLAHVHAGLAKLEQLIININDIMENRIENNLKSLSKTVLVNLPQESSTYTLDEFVEMQSEWIASESKKLKSKNYEVEQAVEDLIQTICSYQLDQHVEPISAEEIQKLSKYYSWSMYQALLHATKYSLNQMKERICGRRNAPKQILKPFFEVDVLLDGDESTLKPSLDEVQSAINRAASHVLKSTRKVQLWFQKDQPEDEREPFYNWIAKDKEIVKVILLLTGSIQGTKNNVNRFLESFSKYSWLWTKNPNDSLKAFSKNSPQLEEYEDKLKEFDGFMDQIEEIEGTFQIGALSLKTVNVKSSLQRWTNNWKDVYSKDIHKKAKTLLEQLTDEIKQIRLKIEKPVKEIDSLGSVMQALEEIRTKQSNIAFQFKPVTDMYSLIEQQLADVMDRDELDSKKVLEKDWDELVNKAFTVRDTLHQDQAEFKKQLIKNIDTLIIDVKKFRSEFVEHGPMVPNLDPAEALNRLKNFNEEYSVYERKYKSYFSGENLFGLPITEYPELVQTKGELEKLDKLYTLYSKVTETITKWHECPWSEIKEEIDKMKDTIENFSRDCQRLPSDAKKFQAYIDLKKKIDDMDEILPLIEALAHESIRDRHWEEIIELSNHQIPYLSETFCLSQLFEADLLKIKEEIEDITDSAGKQMKIEKQLREEIESYWAEAELEIKSYLIYDYPCTISGSVSDIQERLEDHVMMLMQMNAMRCVTPFKSEVLQKIEQLSDVGETIGKWLKVQTDWQKMVSVFTTGDIAKQMPIESKLFRNVDNSWKKIMERASEQKNVIQCCQNDILLNSLPGLQESLDLCQKRLESYLEKKRGVFPRFYFVSNQDLLKILSQGSDPQMVQDDFEKLFDAINRVTFDTVDRRLIKTIHQQYAGAEEEIQFDEPVKCEGNIEDWLCKVEAEMQRSVRTVCQSGSQDLSMPFVEYIHAYPSQIALLGVQMLWTQKITDCLERTRDRGQEFEKKRKEVQMMMNELTGQCRGELPNRLIRTKIETLVTIHVYQKDCFGEIQDAVRAHKIKDLTDFDWLRNTRVYWNQEDNQPGNIMVSITDVNFTYQYEFLGAKERLCITTLTARCYVTLSQALGMNYGGAPAGPAGTGKTETVKDLGRTLGIFVVVTNCSGEHKFRNMAKIFKGICQSGLWGCFDEFNRISLATLSVVAAQVESITQAKKQKLKMFIFPTDPEKPIRLVHACAYFITMNPGYAGRQELPENLKVLFRGVTMMVPDRITIIKVKLASVGYLEFDGIDKKFTILYRLCEEQLSKQRHYDFGLRNILSVLRFAGKVLRDPAEANELEETLIARTLTDMNMSKFVKADKSLFTELIQDIFPLVAGKIKANPHTIVSNELSKRLRDKNLVDKPGAPDFFLKCIQLYETSTVRHGFMVVGQAGCGKTSIYNCLTEALSEVPGNPKYEIKRMNPKAITNAQMYGTMNAVGEWEEGVFSVIWKQRNDKKNKNINWIQCDGPVDAIWIENLNTVLDDNQILTLANAERIPMSDNTKMTFEVENLDNASPATVSRCGIIFVSPTDLYWEPLFEAWTGDRADKNEANMNSCSPDEGKWVKDLVHKYFKKHNFFNYSAKQLKQMMKVPEVIQVTQMLNLLTACIMEYTDQRQETIDQEFFEKIWLYCFAWAVGGLLEADDRMKIHKEVLEKINAPLPPISVQKQNFDKETIFDWYINPETRAWEMWQPETWNPPKKIVFSQLLIPTADSTRADYIITKMGSLPAMRSEKRKEPGMQHTLLVGGVGTCKTSVILMHLSKQDPEKFSNKRINFSFYTLPHNFQDSISGEVEKKNAKNYFPFGNKHLTVFLDDVSMPEVNEWGDQITLEITRQLIDHRGFYSLEKDLRGEFMNIYKLNYLAAMGHPGGGRNDVPNRIKRLFFSINMTPPSNRSVENIYGRILEVLFNPKRYDKEIVDMRPLLIEATITLWETTAKRLLPTPTKFHYNFNIRELARVFGGICRVAQAHEYKVIKTQSKLKDKPAAPLFLIGLWRHECQRTFVDKLSNMPDKKIFDDILNKVTKEKFRDSLGYEEDQLMTDYLFADFQRDDVFNEDGEMVETAPFVYEACADIPSIKKRVNQRLEEFNEANPAKKMNLVIFDDALFHLLRMTRILNSKSGNILLVGVGGSGKQSLTKLAAYLGKHFQFQILLSKSYSLNSMLDDIKTLYEKSGPQGQSVTFLMTDAEIKNESFLEAINSMLATGEIPGMILKDDKELLSVQAKPLYMKEEGKKGEDPNSTTLWNFVINRVRDNLHMALAFSPVGTKFRARAQKFPSLFSQCSIDWFLPWPEEALISVSTKFLGEFKIDCPKEVKQGLMIHMGKVHKMVSQVCLDYFQQMRRHVYVTPKSYLSFISAYNELYTKKYKIIDVDEQNIISGLEKLATAGADVEVLKQDLAKKGVILKTATEDTDRLLKTLDVENKRADVKAKEVNAVTEACVEKRNQIEADKADAMKDLEAALPSLEKAKKAVDSILQKDITDISKIQMARDTVRIIFDAVQVLFMGPLVPVAPKVVTLMKKDVGFIEDSYDTYVRKLLTGPLLKQLTEFSLEQKDNINDETIEFLEPYINFKSEDDPPMMFFTPEVAKQTSGALVGLCTWAAAMSDYTKNSKIVKPKMKMLEFQTAALQEATDKLQQAQEELDEVNAYKAKLRAQYDEKIAYKQELQDDATKTRKKMDQANRLINSLEDNKIRWIEQRKEFASTKERLVGNVAKACAFVSYCGPFNTEYRKKLTVEFFQTDLEARGIPASGDLDLTQFLVDQVTIGEWNLQGLPSDPLSIENGIMVTRSTRYPLMIDPQSQAIEWIKRREPELEARGFVFTLSNPNLKDHLKVPLQDGNPVMIENIENEVDPMLDPILEKQWIKKGRNKLIKLGDSDLDYDERFRLYMTSRLANPHFSPELAAKTTIIDFTVTQNGLEQQLLGRLISKEQKQLEEQLTQLQEDVTANTKVLQDSEDQLLARLGSGSGSLLDDAELIDVLSEIKTKSKEVSEILKESKEKTIEIGEKREQYRPVAARGAVLYFCIVEMSLVNWMYNTSLQQFLDLFDYGIDRSAKAQLVKDRVANIISTMTMKTYRYINRGLFEKDKITFKLQMALKIMIKSGLLNAGDVGMFLKAGAGIDDRNKKINWMDQKTWLNVVALSKHKFGNDHQAFFKDFPDKLIRNDQQWKQFLGVAEPENQETTKTDYDEKMENESIGHFLHMCLIRCIREDRTVLAAQNFIRHVLGEEYMAPVTDQITEQWEESMTNKPILYLLSAGADPTNSIDEFARKKKINTQKVSMGEEQEIAAKANITNGFRDGFWVILNNCHLSLEFMAEMEEILNPKGVEVHEAFRLWITCQPNDEFPLGLLQMAIKVTTEPPKGLKAGLARTYQTMVNQDFLEKVEPYDKWKNIVFCICFMHSVVQERRKYGPLGFCIPYEFNTSDLEASLGYIENHMTSAYANNSSIQWRAVQYMVVDVQYGGRITDNMDRHLFSTYGNVWITDRIFTENEYCFSNATQEFSYIVPGSDVKEIGRYMDYINSMPEKDSPTVFGLNNSADMSFRLAESSAMLNVLIDTMPKDSGGSGGKTKEEEVRDKCEQDLLKQLPPNFVELEYNEMLAKSMTPKGLDPTKNIPLDIFLRQEIEQFQKILNIVRTICQDIVMAIDGTIIMTEKLVAAINQLYDFRVPREWQFDPTGVEISWLTPSLGGWMKGLIDRHYQLNNWITRCQQSRPPSYWLTGFYNPQGFLTAVMQEVTRMHAEQKWSLEQVEPKFTPEKDIIQGDDGRVEKQLTPKPEGAFIHGLYLEGAQWSKQGQCLEEQTGKDLYFQFPILHITAQSTAVQTDQRNPRAGGRNDQANIEKTYYFCPVYKIPKRNDKYLVTRVYLRPETVQPVDTKKGKDDSSGMKPRDNWTLKGVALLCCKE